MVTASTLVMIISMTFRIPYAPFGAIFALILSRDSLEVTANEVRMLAIGFVCAAAYVLLGAMLVLDDPMLRMVWVIATLFLIFFGISVTSNWTVAARFGYLVIITIPLWDLPITADAKVTNTLWAVGTITIASGIALLLEIAYAALRRGSDLTNSVTDQLACVEKLLRCYAEDLGIEASMRTAISRMAMLGTSRLRRILYRSNRSPQYVREMGAVVALTGRLVDLAANLAHFAKRAAAADQGRIARVANQIADIREKLTNGSIPCVAQPDRETDDWPSFPLLGEIERTVLLIPKSFHGSEPLRVFASTGSEEGNRPAVFAPGALLWEHLKFGLRGCLAATVCYLIYNALFWPEIATAVTTCFLTAQTTIGSSRQKQALRFGGALVGAGISLGAQIFVLPYIDSIAGFAVLFVLVATFAAWIATSSPRLSYLGVQVFVAFALVHLQEFKFQTSLTIGRDRVLGILLGLFVMWLCFDQLWSAAAGVEMRHAFTSSVRLLAQLAREPLSNDLRSAINTSYMLREKINTEFEKTRFLADGVLFEFGPSREADLKCRDLVRRWQPQLSALFLMRIASLKYRLQSPGFETPESIRLLQAAYDAESADQLERMAKRVEDAGRTSLSGFDDPPDSLKRTLDALEDEARRTFPTGRAESFTTLLDGINRLTSSLTAEVAAEFAT
jgi:multidrug resistance protein MdtO